MMKRLIGSVVAVAALVLSVLAAPASAAVPEYVTNQVTHPGVNACTGEFELVTISWDIWIHDDGNGARVLTFKSSVTTSLGWTGGGTETQVATGNDVLINNLAIKTSDGEDGLMMVRAHRKIDLTTGEVVVQDFRMNCRRS
jgi:hypothetical protein